VVWGNGGRGVLVGAFFSGNGGWGFFFFFGLEGGMVLSGRGALLQTRRDLE